MKIVARAGALQRTLKHRGWSLTKLSLRTGASKSHLSEVGRGKPVSFSLAARITEETGAEFYELWNVVRDEEVAR